MDPVPIRYRMTVSVSVSGDTGTGYGGNRLPRRNLGQPVYKPPAIQIREKKEKEIEALASPSRSHIRPHLRGSRRSGLRHLLRLHLSLRHLPIHQRNSSEREMDDPIHQSKALTWTFARIHLPSAFSVASSSSSAVH